jgi:hypothetical protein
MKKVKKINTAIVIFCLIYFFQYFTIGEIPFVKNWKLNQFIWGKEIVFSIIALVIVALAIKKPIS